MTRRAQLAGFSRAPIGVLLVICAAVFFTVVNASAVVVVLPELGDDLSVEPGALSWVMTGYLLVYGIAIPIYGRLADIHGARSLFLAGLAVFAVGSVVCSLAPDYPLLLAGRVVQAAGGAAIPGLGMTLASRAYGEEQRGFVLGVLGATIGIAGGIGPLIGGALTEIAGWQTIFAASGLAALILPFGWFVLSREEERTPANLDIIGAVALAAFVGGALLIPSEGPRSGWDSPLVLLGGGLVFLGLVGMVIRQRTAAAPFIPREFLGSARYIALVTMSFLVMAANVAPLIGLPLMLALVHGLTAIEIGLVMLAGAILSSITGVVAGRLSDSQGPRTPAALGAPLMVVAVLGLSTSAGDSVWMVAVFAGVLGAGFGFVNTPLAAAVSQVVRGPMLASALSINSMLFFLGGSFGAATLTAITTSREGKDMGALNPLHAGEAAAFSDAFLVLALPLALLTLLVITLPARRLAQTRPGPWAGDCSVPWSPQCEETSRAGAAPATAS